MFQVTFSDQSMDAINRLDPLEQLELIDAFASLSAEQLNQPQDAVGRFHRGGKVFYRLRHQDYRLYFERDEETLHCHYLLHRNTLSDFIFRTKLPMTEEVAVEEDASFWKYLESLTK